MNKFKNKFATCHGNANLAVYAAKWSASNIIAETAVSCSVGNTVSEVIVDETAKGEEG